MAKDVFVWYRMHQTVQQRCFWIPSIGVLEMHNAKKYVVLVWRTERTYLCSSNANKFLRIPSVDAFEMHNAIPCVFFVWRAEHVHVRTKIATKIVFGYVVWMRVNEQCDKICISGVADGTHIPLHQKCQQKCLWIPSMGVFEMHNAKKVCFWCTAPNAHTSVPKVPTKMSLDT